MFCPNCGTRLIENSCPKCNMKKRSRYLFMVILGIPVLFLILFLILLQVAPSLAVAMFLGFIILIVVIGNFAALLAYFWPRIWDSSKNRLATSFIRGLVILLGLLTALVVLTLFLIAAFPIVVPFEAAFLIFSLIFAVGLLVVRAMPRDSTVTTSQTRLIFGVVMLGSVGLGVGFGWWAYQNADDLMVSFHIGKHIASYVSLCRAEQLNNPINISLSATKAIVINPVSGNPDGASLIPLYLKTYNPYEVRFVVCLSRNQSQAGYYTDPQWGGRWASAAQVGWDVTLLDLKNGGALSEFFMGSPPPPSISRSEAGGTHTGSEPTEAFRNWVDSTIQQMLAND